jgi:hypothetical protein
LKFRISRLLVTLQRGEVQLLLSDMSYFWGQMGAGKSSIAKLIDYCLGGTFDLTPALQSEFVTAQIDVELEKASISIERPRQSNSVVATWQQDGETITASVPARKPNGEVLVGTGVETLSDLLFHLEGLAPPKVRKSKASDESELARLSMRDLLWYCYLTQDEIDSSFFHLDANENYALRNKSRDVLRYVVGFHSEKVAAIEALLDETQGQRRAAAVSLDALTKALQEIGLESEDDIVRQLDELRARHQSLTGEVEALRTASVSQRPTSHQADVLRDRAIALGQRIAELADAQAELGRVRDRDVQLVHQLETLSVRLARSVSAREVLSGVSFDFCPRCSQRLPERVAGCCQVCAQPDSAGGIDPAEISTLEEDSAARIRELKDIIARHDEQFRRLKSERDALEAEKRVVEQQRNENAANYDSAYLAAALQLERDKASVTQRIETLSGMVRLPQLAQREKARVALLEAKMISLRRELAEVRREAEKDESSMRLLKQYFLECLVRSAVPGITEDDEVVLDADTFFPEIHGRSAEDSSVATFATLSSGGKKTLFKCCFAIAVHRLAAKLKAPLPELLIIDSAMKNISERENRVQFEDFYTMLYELKSGELANTQVLIIDKEFMAPPHAVTELRISSRHMRPDDPANPPLIPYYSGR